MRTFLRGQLSGVDVTFSPGVDLGHLVFADASARDVATWQRVPEARTVAEEVTVCLDRLASILKEAGCSLADVVKVNCYVTDESHLPELWKTLDGALPQDPVRVTQVTRFAGDARVLLDVTAAR